MSTEISEIAGRLVRYGDLIPCKTAFIDAHTPGSDQKENFTIIGGGVSESVDQHVHLNLPHGFNIGAADNPPDAGTHCIRTELPKCFLYFLVAGGFFGVDGERPGRLF